MMEGGVVMMIGAEVQARAQAESRKRSTTTSFRHVGIA